MVRKLIERVSHSELPESGSHQSLNKRIRVHYWKCSGGHLTIIAHSQPQVNTPIRERRYINNAML